MDRRKDMPVNPREAVSTQDRDAAGLPGGEGTGWRKRGKDRIWGGLEGRAGKDVGFGWAW